MISTRDQELRHKSESFWSYRIKYSILRQRFLSVMEPTPVDSRETANKILIYRAANVLLLGWTWSSTLSNPLEITSRMNEEEILRYEKSLGQSSPDKLLAMFAQCSKVAFLETPMTTVRSLSAYFCSISIPEDHILIVTSCWRFSTRKWPHDWNRHCGEVKLNNFVYISVVYSPVALDAAKARDPANVIVGFTMLSETAEIM